MAAWHRTNVRCVICNKTQKKYIDTDAGWQQEQHGIVSICLRCILKYRPLDSYVVLTHFPMDRGDLGNAQAHIAGVSEDRPDS